MVFRAPGSFTSGDMEAVRLVGPSTPATKRGVSGSLRFELVGRLPREPGGREVELVHHVLHPVVGQGDGGRGEGVGLDDVRAGLEVGRMDRADDLGLGEREEVAVAPQVTRPVGEAVAPVVALAQTVGLDHRPHGAVEHQDPTGEQRLEQGDPVLAGPERNVGHGTTSYEKPRGQNASGGAF